MKNIFNYSGWKTTICLSLRHEILYSLSFHFLAAEKRRNLITELINDQGVATRSFQEIECLILDFLDCLHKKITGISYIPLIFDWPCVSSSQNVALIMHYSEIEIFSAVKSLGKSKAQGQVASQLNSRYWHLVKGSFKALFAQFYDNGRLNSCVHQNFISLIRKKEDMVLVTDQPSNLNL